MKPEEIAEIEERQQDGEQPHHSDVPNLLAHILAQDKEIERLKEANLMIAEGADLAIKSLAPKPRGRHRHSGEEKT